VSDTAVNVYVNKSRANISTLTVYYLVKHSGRLSVTDLCNNTVLGTNKAVFYIAVGENDRGILYKNFHYLIS